MEPAQQHTERPSNVIPLRPHRARPPMSSDARARWFTRDDVLCGADEDCPPDRLCMGGHCI